MIVEPVTIYTTNWCPDCRRVKLFLKNRGVGYLEVNIEEDAAAETAVLRANHGKRKVPTLKVGERYLICSPFDPARLASELSIPLNL
jgi:mycoredoxin